MSIICSQNFSLNSFCIWRQFQIRLNGGDTKIQIKQIMDFEVVFFFFSFVLCSTILLIFNYCWPFRSFKMTILRKMLSQQQPANTGNQS